MSRFLLDSSFVIDLLNEIAANQRGPARAWAARNPGAELLDFADDFRGGAGRRIGCNCGARSVSRVSLANHRTPTRGAGGASPKSGCSANGRERCLAGRRCRVHGRGDCRPRPASVQPPRRRLRGSSAPVSPELFPRGQNCHFARYGFGYAGVLEQRRSRVSQRMESDFAAHALGVATFALRLPLGRTGQRETGGHEEVMELLAQRGHIAVGGRDLESTWEQRRA